MGIALQISRALLSATDRKGDSYRKHTHYLLAYCRDMNGHEANSNKETKVIGKSTNSNRETKVTGNSAINIDIGNQLTRKRQPRATNTIKKECTNHDRVPLL